MRPRRHHRPGPTARPRYGRPPDQGPRRHANPRRPIGPGRDLASPRTTPWANCRGSRPLDTWTTSTSCAPISSRCSSTSPVARCATERRRPSVHAVLSLAIKDLRLLFRNRGALFFSFGWPLIVALRLRTGVRRPDDAAPPRSRWRSSTRTRPRAPRPSSSGWRRTEGLTVTPLGARGGRRRRAPRPPGGGAGHPEGLRRGRAAHVLRRAAEGGSARRSRRDAPRSPCSRAC